MLIIFFVILSSCTLKYKDYKPEDASKFKAPEKYESYMREFYAAAYDEKVEDLMTLFHPNYVEEQHDQNLEGRTDQFLREFFGCPLKEIWSCATLGYYWKDETVWIISVITEQEGKPHVQHWFFEKREGFRHSISLWGAVG